MIIACPACATRYAVPDSAIGVEGRTVRCAKCRHSWYQEGPELDLATLERPEAPVAPPEPAPPVAEPAPTEATSAAAQPHTAPVSVQSEAEPVARAPRPWIGEDAPPQPKPVAPSPSSFEHQPPFRPRRNPAKMWTALAIGFAVVTTGAMGAVAKFGLPDWLPLPQASNSEPDLKLTFPAGRQERRPLANGNDFFNISGTITNIGQNRRAVPTLLIVLRDSRNRSVYTIEASAPKPVLAPGESVAINTAIVDAPKAAVAAEVQWKPQ